MRAILLSCFLMLTSSSLFAQATAPLDPELPYRGTRSNTVTYNVDFSVIVTAPYKTKKLAVWLPIPVSDNAQSVIESHLSTHPVAVQPRIGTEPKFGNKFAYFEFDSPQGAQVIRHQFTIKVSELRWNIDPAKITQIDAWPSSFDKYRQSDSQAVVVDERFNQLLNQIVPQRSNSANDLTDVMKWVQTNFKYDHEAASLSASSEHALNQRTGHCSDYHGFCASLGRALGVPTRVTYGINPFPKNSPSHCKLEAFLAPYGWVSFDVSETQKLVKQISEAPDLSDAEKTQWIQLAQSRLASGFRDNTWFLQTRGTDYDLVPKASQRVAVVRTAYIEADGKPLPEPDPADRSQTKFAWMTAHQYKSDRTVAYPFTDWTTLSPQETNHD